MPKSSASRCTLHPYHASGVFYRLVVVSFSSFFLFAFTYISYVFVLFSRFGVFLVLVWRMAFCDCSS